MTQEMSKEEAAFLLEELNMLEAFKRVAGTPDGQMLICFVFEAAQLNVSPHKKANNSGETAKILGKQSVGRAVFDKFVQAGVDISNTVFSKKETNRIEQIKVALNIKQ